jgi:hypothetical protein
MKCDNCRHAVWDRTSIGHLHPNRAGKCTYAADVPVPRFSQFHARNNKDSIKIRGGWINRGYEFDDACTLYDEG